MTGPDRLRPNEVAGTGDPHTERLTELLRERFGDAYEDMLILQDPRKVRPMLWSDLMPPQDAPALGFRTEPVIGAEAVLDATPPKVTKPDLIADLVKAYKLIRDAPYRRDMGDPSWHRFETTGTVDAEDVTAAPGDHIERTVARLTVGAQEKLMAAAAEVVRAGCTLCVHDGPTATIDPMIDFERDQYVMRVRIRAHALLPGQECVHVPRTQYGDPA